MRSDRSRLTGNFNTKQKTYSTPKKHQTSFQSISGSSLFSSPIKDTKLTKNEQIMCQKEDEFLTELHKFHEEVAQYEEKKDQLSMNSRKLAKDSISLLSLASNLSVYQQKLEQRAKIAQEILSDPIDDFSAEVKLIEQLEKDVELYRSKLPKPPTEEEIQEIEDKLREAEEIQTQNSIKSQQLEKKKIFLEIQDKQIDTELNEIKQIQEEDLTNSKKSEFEELDSSLPDENEASKENIRQLKQKKEELEQRKTNLNQKKKDLDEFEKQIEIEKKQHQEELDELQKKLDQLKETKSVIDKNEIDLNEIAGIKAQLEIDRDDMTQELNRMKRLFEIQKEELGRVERKRNEINRRKNEIEEKKKEIEDKKSNIEQKKESLKQSEEKYNLLVDELDESKRKLAEKQTELEKQQKILKTYQEKIKQLNGGQEPSDLSEFNQSNEIGLNNINQNDNKKVRIQKEENNPSPIQVEEHNDTENLNQDQNESVENTNMTNQSNNNQQNEINYSDQNQSDRQDE